MIDLGLECLIVRQNQWFQLSCRAIGSMHKEPLESYEVSLIFLETQKQLSWEMKYEKIKTLDSIKKASLRHSKESEKNLNFEKMI